MATIPGLVDALEQGLEQGGLSPDQRRTIYRAIDEQLELFFGLDETSTHTDDGHAQGPHRPGVARHADPAVTA